MPNVDSTLMEIAKWKYLIKTDLTKAFYQIPLSHDSKKYCGVVTPFRGVRVYQTSAMGMPGSETALEELMSRILGDLLITGKVAKIADDLYCGADSINDLLQIWRNVLTALDNCGLKLSASKAVVCPTSTVILGWTWTQGNLSATKHRLSTLSTCDSPSTIKGLRSFIGAYKVLSRVIKGCSSILSPLENYVAGKSSAERVIWSDELEASFTHAKHKVATSTSIVLPKAEDQLWIVTDGAVRDPGIGATLYVTRGENKPMVAGFFSAKLKKHQPTWLPCEIEALSIAAAIKHYSPYIIQSKHRGIVLTDSKPCVQAYEKLNRGSYSSSARLSTFLSTASSYQLTIRHLSGSSNLVSDFSSRNAPPCENIQCQICQFVNHLEESVINSVTVNDIVSGSTRLPYTNRLTWIAAQSECHEIRRTIAHLKQGTRPSKKVTNIKDVKRYLRNCTVSRDGLLVVRREEPFSAAKECIVVPRNVLPGLITALHIRLKHSTHHQLKQVVNRHFFALDLDKVIESTTCATLKQMPSTILEQSTGDPPLCVGTEYAADVIRRAKQCILVVRETVTSFTTACFIDNEKAETLREGLIKLILPLHPIESPLATIRTDPAPGFNSVSQDSSLNELNIQIEIGEAKNVNKNPVAEKAIQELQKEILRQDPSGNPISQVLLASAVSVLNTRIRNRGLSAHEMWFRREQFNNNQLNTSDEQLIKVQHENRLNSHFNTSKLSQKLSSEIPIKEGNIIYLRTEGNKTKARRRYIVVSILNEFCYVRAFSHNQLRSKTYKVRLSDCFLATADYNLLDTTTTVNMRHGNYSSNDSDSEYDNEDNVTSQSENIHPQLEETPTPVEISNPRDSISPIVISNNESNIVSSSQRPTRARNEPKYLSDYVR